MKLKYIRLAEKGMQVASGRLRQDLSADFYELTLISNIRSVKINHPDWDQAVYVPLENIANYSPMPGEYAK